MRDISPRKVLTALIHSQGIISDAATMLNTQPRNILRIMDENPEIQEEINACHVGLYDEALRSAKDLVSMRDKQMTKWVLERMGEKTGLKRPKQRVEVSGDPTAPIVTRKQMDLSNLTDEELEVIGKVIKDKKGGNNEAGEV